MSNPRRIYPAWLNIEGREPTPLETRLAETLGRIADRTDGWLAERAEKDAALTWCQANGNPHKNTSGGN